jgi:Trk K+ transport system NAD-binding subunit
VVAVTGDDAANLGIALAVREMNPRARTVARLFDADFAAKVGGSLGVTPLRIPPELAGRRPSDLRSLEQPRVVLRPGSGRFELPPGDAPLRAGEEVLVLVARRLS